MPAPDAHARSERVMPVRDGKRRNTCTCGRLCTSRDENIAALKPWDSRNVTSATTAAGFALPMVAAIDAMRPLSFACTGCAFTPWDRIDSQKRRSSSGDESMRPATPGLLGWTVE